LFGGPDIFFRVLDLDNDGIDELLASEFFNSSLSIYYSPSGNFSSGDVVEVVVDNQIGRYQMFIYFPKGLFSMLIWLT
jgi:hypothetical protein